MRIVIQRVEHASVEVDGREHSSIGPGLLALLGISKSDDEADIRYLAEKLANLRVCTDAAAKMNLSVLDAQGEVLVIPNFTLAGDTRKGRRPSFDSAMAPDLAEPMFERFCETLEGLGVRVARGVFRAHMHVRLLNDGPVTLVLDSPQHD